MLLLMRLLILAMVIILIMFIRRPLTANGVRYYDCEAVPLAPEYKNLTPVNPFKSCVLADCILGLVQCAC